MLYFLDASDGGPPGVTLDAAARWLDGPELDRLGAYRTEERQREFLLGRYLVKTVLRAFHGVAEPRLTCVEGEKPHLHGGGPRFSLAHAGGAVAVYVSPSAEVGIDVEPVRPYSAALAEAALSPAERAARPGDEAFHRIWTAKEAYMKRAGAGLAIAPRRLTVDLERNLVHDGETGAAEGFAWTRVGRFVVSWM